MQGSQLEESTITAKDRDSGDLATEIHYREEAFYRMVKTEEGEYYEEAEEIPFKTVDTHEVDNEGVTDWSF